MAAAPAAIPGAPDPASDGRHRRAATSRAAVVDALLALYEEGNLSPAAGEIAARAGVSERSVFRHFVDLESLAQAAIERQWARVGPHFAPPSAEGSRDERIEALVSQRLAVHGVAAGTARAAALLAPSSNTIQRAMAARRALLRRQTAAQFAVELDALGRAERTELLAALEAATAFEQVDYLRNTAGLSVARTAGVMTRTIRGLLDGSAR